MLLRTVVAAAVLLRGAGACTATLSINIDGVSVKLAFDNTASVFGTALRHVAELGDAHGGLMGGSCETGDAFCAAGELADGAHALLAERAATAARRWRRRPRRWTSQVGAHEGDSRATCCTRLRPAPRGGFAPSSSSRCGELRRCTKLRRSGRFHFVRARRRRRARAEAAGLLRTAPMRRAVS